MTTTATATSKATPTTAKAPATGRRAKATSTSRGKRGKATTATSKGKRGKATTATSKGNTTKVVTMPKCANARPQVAKPQRKMLTKISKINKHPGKALRIKRFGSYKVGMTLQHCKETEGLDHLDIGFYVEHGLMEVTPATDKEYDAAVAEWKKTQAN